LIDTPLPFTVPNPAEKVKHHFLPQPHALFRHRHLLFSSAGSRSDRVFEPPGLKGSKGGILKKTMARIKKKSPTPLNDFDEWIAVGIKNGWCGPPVCYTHDGLPTSSAEDSEFEGGSDPCMHIIRLYEDGTMKRDIEENHSPSTWRNHFTADAN